MIKNRRFAFWFRILAAIGCLLGILAQLDLHNGQFIATQMLYFTFQTNLLTFVLFVALAIRTGIDKRKNGIKGSAHYFYKFYGTILTSMILVSVVFWVAIAPAVWDSPEIRTYGNFATHLLHLILLIADYIMFSEAGRLTKFDPLWFLIYPVTYTIQAGILGVFDVRYYTPFSDGSYWAPYPFLDWSRFGALTLFMILGIGFVVFGMGYLFFLIDKKIAQKQQKTRNR